MASTQEIVTRTFLMTVSPKDPVTEDCQRALVRYIRSNCQYGYVVSEHGKSGKLHLHATLAYDTHIEKKKLQANTLTRILHKYGHPDAKGGIALKVTVQYNHDWYDAYLKKETDSTVLFDKYDRDAITELFPSKSTQEYLQSARHAAAPGLPADPFVHNHVQRWIEMHPDASTALDAARYLYERMYVLQDMVCIQDKRRLAQLSQCLYEFRTKQTEPCIELKRLINSYDGFNCDFSVTQSQHPAARP